MDGFTEIQTAFEASDWTHADRCGQCLWQGTLATGRQHRVLVPGKRAKLVPIFDHWGEACRYLLPLIAR